MIMYWLFSWDDNNNNKATINTTVNLIYIRLTLYFTKVQGKNKRSASQNGYLC